MTLLNHGDKVVIGFDLAGELVAQDVDQIITGEHAGGDFPMYQALFGEEHQGDHDQRHVVMPGLPSPNLVVDHAAGALGILEGPFDEMPVGLHAGQSAQRRLGLGIGETELEFFALDLPADQQMSAARACCFAIPDEDPTGQILGNDLSLLAGAYRQTAPGAIGLINPLVGMDLRQKGFALVIQIVQ